MNKDLLNKVKAANSQDDMSYEEFEQMLCDFIREEAAEIDAQQTSQDATTDDSATDNVCTETLNDTRLRRGRLADIRSVVVNVQPLVAKRRYMSGPVDVYITGADDVFFSQDSFTCFVYREQFFPVCKNYDEGEVDPETPNCFSLTIGSERVWMPGDYVLYVRDEREGSLARMDFTLDASLQVSAQPLQRCVVNGTDFILTSIVEKFDEDWLNLALHPGTAQLRRYIVDDWQLDFFNKFREVFSQDELTRCRHLVITSQHETLTEQLMRRFKKVMGGDDMNFYFADCSTLYDAANNSPYQNLLELLDKGGSHVFCLNHLSALSAVGGKLIVKKFVQHVEQRQGRAWLWLCGTQQEVSSLFEQYASLRELFPQDNRLALEPAKPHELVESFLTQLRVERLRPSDDCVDRLTRTVIDDYERGLGSKLTVENIRLLIRDQIKPRYLERAYGEMHESRMAQLESADIDFDRITGSKTSFDECMNELNAMVGLDSIKQSVASMARNTQFYLERRRRGLHTSSNIAYHCIFTGNPGTGKTTVARMLGKIYHSLGLLSRGEVIAVDRTRLVGRYIGETEENMKVVLEEARGNVLFIDEAYTLYDGAGDRKDFGARVIDSLLTVLTQPEPDMLIVFAGYEKEMDAMLSTNPGLMGRFPYKYKFGDYDAAQLTEIATRLLRTDDYILTSQAEAKLREVIAKTLEQRTPNFGNARWIDQLVRNGIIPAMANRITLSGSDDYQHVEADDVKSAYEKFNPKNVELRPRRKLGFTA